MDVARLIREARLRAGLSKRALARRAGTSPAAVVAYETGRRDPSTGTLQRLLAAAGVRAELQVVPVRPMPDPRASGRRLVEVLELADQLPHRPAARRLAYPSLPR